MILAVSGLLLGVAACSKASDGSAPPPTSRPPATAAPPTAPAPTTTAAPITTPAPTTTDAPPTTSAAATARRKLLSDVLARHLAAGEFVGARIALRERDGTVTEVTAGTKGLDPAGGPVDPGVAWNVGSVTKTFVAVVVLQLADEGRLDLDAGIERYFPDLPGASRITPRQLLQHTSGLAEYGNQPAVVANPRRHWTPAELIAVAEAAGRVGEPGGPHHYSNTNYIVLGEIIDKVTGHTWGDEVRTRIAQRLGLENTSEIRGDRGPVGYKVVDGKFVDTTLSADPSIGGAAGALQSTDHDLLLFAAALADGTLLSPTSQAAMRAFVPAEDYSQFGIVHTYGLGLEQYASDAITVTGHMGTGEAQSAYVGYDAEHGTAIAVSTNTAVAGPQAMMAVEALTAVNAAG